MCFTSYSHGHVPGEMAGVRKSCISHDHMRGRRELHPLERHDPEAIVQDAIGTAREFVRHVTRRSPRYSALDRGLSPTRWSKIKPNAFAPNDRSLGGESHPAPTS